MPKIYLKEWPPYTPPDQAKKDNVLEAAKLMMNAVFTPPSHGGIPQIEGCIVYGYEELEKIAQKMEEIAYLQREDNEAWERICKYEAVMVRDSDVVFFIGSYRAGGFPFDAGCGLCAGRADCSRVYEGRTSKYGLIDISDRRTDKLIQGPLCTLHVHDFGVAVGAAMWMSTRLLVDAKLSLPLGIAGQKMGYCPNSAIVAGIGVAALSKNPYTDTNPNYHLINMQTVLEQTRRQYVIFPRQTAVDYKKWDPSRKFIFTPCSYACPLGIDIPGYVGGIAEHKFEESIDLIRRKTPFVGVLGRVCRHPCQTECRRAQLDEEVNIVALKRFLADWEVGSGRVPPLPEVSETKEEGIAIVGSGPAGLSCAFHLAKVGYKVTIFEALPVAGGMLAAGIPEYRLPMEVLNREIKFLTDMGVEIRTSTPLGKGLTFDDIFAQGYKAIFVAIGAHKGRKLGIEGEELKGVLDGLSFLKEIKLGKRKSLKGKVVVIGGGNVAIDAARSAMRLGAGEVTIAYRRTREEMPASSEEIEQAENEGVKINYLAAPAKILGANGKVSEIEFTPMKLGPPDATERRATVPKKAPSFTTGVSTVIVAIGEEPDLSFLPEEHKFAIDRGNKFTIDTATLATSVPGVFAGGDAAGVPATVVDAMASGEKAAISIDRFIRGEPAPMPIFDEEPYYPEKRAPIPRAGEIPQGTAQIAMGMLPTEERITNFREVNMAFTEEEAVKEAQRCIRCDLELGTSELLFGK